MSEIRGCDEAGMGVSWGKVWCGWHVLDRITGTVKAGKSCLKR